jgi:hypothetical protein
VVKGVNKEIAWVMDAEWLDVPKVDIGDLRANEK